MAVDDEAEVVIQRENNENEIQAAQSKDEVSIVLYEEMICNDLHKYCKFLST